MTSLPRYRLVIRHPLAIRWCHWLNFPLLAGMIVSGLEIYWANDVYRLGWGDWTWVRFFPESVWERLGLGYRLAEGMSWHFLLMWLFAANGVAYVLYTALSGEWRHLLPGAGPGGYPAAQRWAYTGILAMGAGSLATGLAIYRPVQLGGLTALLGGYEAARAEHFALTVGYVLFFGVHVTQVARAGWRNFRGMVVGRQVVEG